MVAPKTTRNSPVSPAPRFAIKELAFNNLYEIARRRWKTLVAFQLLTVALAILYCFVGGQKYESSAQILVMKKDQGLVSKGSEGVDGGEAKVSDETLATQMATLHSPKILNAAMDKIVDRAKLEEVKARQKEVEKQTSTNLYYLSMRAIYGAPVLEPEDPSAPRFVPIDVEQAFGDSGAAAILENESAAETPTSNALAATTEAAANTTPAANVIPEATSPSPEAGKQPASSEIATATPESANKPGEVAATDPNFVAEEDEELITPDLVANQDMGDWLPLSQLPGILENLDTNEKVIDYVKDRLVITRGGSGQEREAHIISVAFRHPDMVEAKLVVDAIMSAYQKFLDEKFSDVSKEAAKLIDRASKELETAVTDATRDLQEFRERSPVVFEGGANTNIPRMRWEATQKELLEVQLLLKDARSRLAVIEPQLVRLKQSGKLNHARLITLIDKENAERLSSLSMIARTEAQTMQFLSKQYERQQLASAETEKLLKLTSQLQSMKVELGPKHPEVLKLTEEMNHVQAYVDKLAGELKVTDEPVTTPEELMDAYVDLLRNDVMTLESREQDLLESASREEEESKGLIGYELEGAMLRDKAMRAANLHQVVLERLGQINLAKDYSGFINEMMELPDYGVEVWPNVPILIALAIAMGLVLGAGTCGAQEYFDRSFRDPEEIRRDLDLPLLTHVPDLHKKAGSIAAGSRVHYSLCSFHRPKSREAEVFRGLRTSLFFSSEGQQCSVIMSTSPNKGDGKSTMVTNLAVSIAQAGYKILLIDCDMRRPSAHKLLGLSNAIGLSNLLAGEKRPGDVIQSTETDNLSVITAGPAPQNPAELLTSPAFENFLKSAREKYRFVLLDCPPVLAVADPCIIAPRADGVVMVLRVNADSRPQALRAKEMLQRVNGRILGIVVNASNEATKAGYGRYSESSYGFGYDYGTSRNNGNSGYYDSNGDDEVETQAGRG